MHECVLCRHAVSVCSFVCLSPLWILSKRINISSHFFPESGSHSILAFPCQTLRQYSDGDPRNGSVKFRWGRQKSRFYIWLHSVLWTVRLPNEILTAATDRSKLLTLVAGNWRRLFFTGDNDEVFVTRSLNVTPKTTEQYLIVQRTERFDIKFKRLSASWL